MTAYPSYIDRHGKAHTPDASSTIRPRKGVFAICIHEGKILLSWPACAPDRPELPGGGIEAGEGLEEALIRELQEEAAVNLTVSHAPLHRVTRMTRFYAEFSNEFWDYTQSYLRLDERDAARIYFEGEHAPEDALKSAWVNIETLSEMSMHAVHAQMLEEMMS
jgi:8-oxo-dGTP pyrophosphatase MutT (NUDIX family)